MRITITKLIARERPVHFSLNHKTRILSGINGEVHKLVRKEFTVLERLWQKPGEYVSTEVLLKAGWGYSEDRQNIYVAKTICDLRKKLGDTEPRQFIHTEYCGYVLIAGCEHWEEEEPPPPPEKMSSPPHKKIAVDVLSTGANAGNYILFDGFKNYQISGFQFLTKAPKPWGSSIPDEYADIMVWNPNADGNSPALFWLPSDDNAKDIVEGRGPANAGIIRMSEQELDAVKTAPSSGYQVHGFAPEKGGIYCVRTWDGQHFAKIKVTDISNDSIRFDWIFQPSGSRTFDESQGSMSGSARVPRRHSSGPKTILKNLRSLIPTRFNHPSGWFEKDGDVWKEFNTNGSCIYTFKELSKDTVYINLFDDTRCAKVRRFDAKDYPDHGRPMYFRIPIAGGPAQWTYPNPIEWADVMIVSPVFQNGSFAQRLMEQNCPFCSMSFDGLRIFT